VLSAKKRGGLPDSARGRGAWPGSTFYFNDKLGALPLDQNTSAQLFRLEVGVQILRCLPCVRTTASHRFELKTLEPEMNQQKQEAGFILTV
jgi:hypothetical protein